MRHPVMRPPPPPPIKTDSDVEGASDPEQRAFLSGLDIRLRTVISETMSHRKLLATVNAEAFKIIPVPGGSEKPIKKLARLSASSSTTPNLPLNRRARHVLDGQPTRTQTQKKNAHKREKKKDTRRAALEAKTSITATAEKPFESMGIQCPGCAQKPKEDRCIRTIYVQENPAAADYLGHPITCALDGDRLPPLKIPTVHFPSDYLSLFLLTLYSGKKQKKQDIPAPLH